MALLRKILGDANEKYLKSLQPVIDEINNLESMFEGFSNTELTEKTKEFRDELNKGRSLGDILPRAFALTREAAKRTLSQRHFDVQLIGGIVLHQGKIAEMKTGEGKTLAATLAIYLNALPAKGVHVVTVNDYLAKRDTVWMGQIFHALGLSVGCIVHDAAFVYDPEYQAENQKSNIKNPGREADSLEGRNENLKFKNSERDELRDTVGGFKVVKSYLRPVSRQEAYAADITYGTNNEFGFDYLRDNMAYDLNQMVQGRKTDAKQGRETDAKIVHNYAIVDEVDSILIDEARTPLIISAPDIESSKMYQEFARIMPQLDKERDYEIDEKMRAVTLTEAGIERVEKILGMKDIYQEKGIKYLHHLEQGLRAEVLFKRDRDYVVKDGEVIIVDEFTGRLMPGRRYSGGLHQALEAKEGVNVQPESMTLASITFQNYFRMYDKLAGMTGTAATSAEEFYKVYKLEVIIIPTNKPMIRKDLPDRIYKNQEGKLKALIEEIKVCHKRGQPVLVGTTSIEKNEYLGKLLEREGIPHQILNAKHHEREGEIIAQAGKPGQVTIATNMAGRGVDIILGGYPPSKPEIRIPNTEKNPKSQAPNPKEESGVFKKWQEDHNKVVALGGLYVIGTERHEARRVDNQLRGRSGRQGDPGLSCFFISLEDDLLRIFGGERIKALMDKLRLPADQPIEANLVSGVIESAQSKIEGLNFDLRKHLLDYDDVLNKQREVIYKKRREILEKSEIRWTRSGLPEGLHPKFEKNPKSQIPNSKSRVQNGLREYILEIVKRAGFAEDDYRKKEQEVGEANMRQIEKIVALRTLDMLWMDHLEDMDYLRDSVRLRAYGQQDPLVEYKNEGHKIFQRLLESIDANIVQMLMRVSLKKPDSGPAFSQPSTTFGSRTSENPHKVGRNDPCPCGKKDPGTGRPMKYKKCCGK